MRCKQNPVRQPEDIVPDYRETPVAELLGYHNLSWDLRTHERAQLLIVTCMDPRIVLRVPQSFAFVLRTAGANIRNLLFEISYAVAVGGVSAVCVIGHSDCAMVDVQIRRGAGSSRRTSLPGTAGPVSMPRGTSRPHARTTQARLPGTG